LFFPVFYIQENAAGQVGRNILRYGQGLDCRAGQPNYNVTYIVKVIHYIAFLLLRKFLKGLPCGGSLYRMSLADVQPDVDVNGQINQNIVIMARLNAMLPLCRETLSRAFRK
jgi:hypothetical protein